MKKIGLLSAALLLSAGVFAQSEPKNEHGTEVRSAAQATYSGSRGAEVSTTASAKSHGVLAAGTEGRVTAKEARKARKAERLEAAAEMKAEHKSATMERKEELKGAIQAGAEDLRDLKSETRSNLKADLKSSRSEVAEARTELSATKRELRKSARKERRSDLPVKAKVKADAGLKTQLRRPKINGNLNAGAALGL